MNLLRLRLVLAAMLALTVMALLLVLHYSQNLQTTHVAFQPLLQPADAARATTIEIIDSGSKRVFAKASESNAWRQVGEGWVYAADSASVDKFLQGLSSVRLGAVKTAQPQNWAALELRDPNDNQGSAGRRIRLLTADNTVLLDIILGKTIVPPRPVLDGAPLDGRFYVRYSNTPQARAAQSPQPVATLLPALQQTLPLPERAALLPSLPTACADLIEFFAFSNVQPRDKAPLQQAIKKNIAAGVSMLLQPDSQNNGVAWVTFDGLSTPTTFAYAVAPARANACVQNK